MNNDVSFFEKFYENKNLPIKKIFFTNSLNKNQAKILKQITKKKKFLIVSDKVAFKILGKQIFDNIKVEFDPEKQMWSIYNDGNGIDVAKHPTEKDEKNKPIWIPGLILGELLEH